MNRPLRLAGCSWIFRRVFVANFVVCSPRFGNPLAAVGARFIVPAYMNVPTKWRTVMCVR
ncbi:hypothetical protein [Prevotella pallens]|uniref:hypothetical protein n=1 Tax=Prevotella pallens TaxID=60133 RepID=UPI00352F69EB